MKVFCTLTREQASLYAAVVEEADKALEAAEGIQRKGLILATLSKLKQVCNHPAQFLGDNSRHPRPLRQAGPPDGDARGGAARRATGPWSSPSSPRWVRSSSGILQETFGREVLFLHGGVPKKQRDRMVERFQTDRPDGAAASSCCRSRRAAPAST